MMRGRCLHLGPLPAGRTGVVPRPCARGVNGGPVVRAIDCETCPLWEAAGAAPARKPLPVLTACPRLGERLPGQPCGSPLLRCKRHGDVTVRVLKTCAGADRSCVTCPDHPAKQGSPT